MCKDSACTCFYLKSCCAYCVQVYVKVAWMLQNLILHPDTSVFCGFYCLLSTDLHKFKLVNSEKHLALPEMLEHLASTQIE